MKKYKVLKPYPGSEYLGEEIKEWDISHKVRYDPLFNQYYEEVVEKDYEILSIIPDSSTNGIIFKHNCPEIESYLKYGDYNIHSVKKLLDGELFGINDLVSNGSQEGKILRIRLTNDGKYQFSCALQNGWTYFTSYKKTIKPLFTTEDGVDVFEGDEYWNVNALFNINECSMIRDITSLERIAFNNINSNKSFSTKKAAEDYVLLNRRLLSFGDIQEFLKIKDCNKVLNLAKDRLHHGKD
jgi:hypothetical protein